MELRDALQAAHGSLWREGGKMNGLTFGIALVLLASNVAGAQLCRGMSSFATGPVRVGGGATFTDGSRTLGASVAFGAAQGVFGDVGVSTVDADDIDDNATAFGVNAGYATPLTSSRRVEFCPIAGFAWQSGPSFDTEFFFVEASSRALSFGGSVGVLAKATPNLDLVPFAAASYVSMKVTLDISNPSGTERERVEDTRDFTHVTVGAGLVLSRRVTLQPAIHFPIGLEGADPAFAISLAYTFGSIR